MLLMAYFTLAWMGIAISGLPTKFIAIPLFLFTPISIAIAPNGIGLLVAAKQFPESTDKDKSTGKHSGK